MSCHILFGVLALFRKKHYNVQFIIQPGTGAATMAVEWQLPVLCKYLIATLPPLEHSAGTFYLPISHGGLLYYIGARHPTESAIHRRAAPCFEWKKPYSIEETYRWHHTPITTRPREESSAHTFAPKHCM